MTIMVIGNGPKKVVATTESEDDDWKLDLDV